MAEAEKKKREATPLVRLTQHQMERLADMVAERVARRIEADGYAEEKYMTYREAADYLGYKLSTMRKMVCLGEVPCERLNGRQPRFTKASLTKWMRQRSEGASRR